MTLTTADHLLGNANDIGDLAHLRKSGGDGGCQAAREFNDLGRLHVGTLHELNIREQLVCASAVEDTAVGHHNDALGKVGNDLFGTQLKNAVEEVGIDTRNLVIDNEVHTTLAFVHTYPDGDRDFSFYRNPGADMMLTKDEIQEDLIRDSRIFHFGTLSSTHEGVREATRYAIDVAKEAGCIVSFDPNLRPPLWKSLDDAKAEIEYGLGKCDILKISDNEVEFLFGTTDYDKGAALLKEKYNIPLILITLGKDGSRAYYKDMKVEAAPFLQEKTIETTGAGDTFCASSLNYVLEHGLDNLTEENLKELLTFANAAASLITTRKGALRVMSTKEEVLDFMKSRGC